MIRKEKTEWIGWRKKAPLLTPGLPLVVASLLTFVDGTVFVDDRPETSKPRDHRRGVVFSLLSTGQRSDDAPKYGNRTKDPTCQDFLCTIL